MIISMGVGKVFDKTTIQKKTLYKLKIGIQIPYQVITSTSFFKVYMGSFFGLLLNV